MTELVSQAISFLNAHRESLLTLLRENQQVISLEGVEEFRLIISILAMILHKIPSDDLVSAGSSLSTVLIPNQRSPSSFGAFHLAVLSVAARFFDHDAWTDRVSSQEEAVKCGCLFGCYMQSLKRISGVAGHFVESSDSWVPLHDYSRPQSRVGISGIRRRFAAE